MKRPEKTIFLKYFWIFCIGFIGLILFSYFYVDQKIALYFHSIPLKEQLFFKWSSDLIHPTVHLMLWPILFYFFRFIFKLEYIANRFLLIALAVVFSNFVLYPLKEIFGRLRPEVLFSNQKYGFSFFSSQDFALSFPSGHAIACAAIMASLGCIYPRYFFYFFFGAIGISFLRVASTAHFFSDILASVFLGFLITELLFIPMKKQAFKFYKT